MNKATLTEAIKLMAAERNESEVETITAMQVGAATLGDGEATLAMLCEIKRDFITI